jgi:hypothetical protein
MAHARGLAGRREPGLWSSGRPARIITRSGKAKRTSTFPPRGPVSPTIANE